MADLIGSQLGNYRLVKVLGKGGFANVYLGEHIHLNRSAAIKVLQTRLEGSDIEQFRNEARLIANLNHPHIVPVLDFGVQDDMPFLVMAYAVNGTLRQYYNQRLPMPLAMAAAYGQQVASALQYAHDQRLIHRDVKPENILLGANQEALLSDFGLALITQSTTALARSNASMGDAAGTIYYMAPEQIQGHPSAASDQYAFAVVIYEWLTGGRLFSGTTYMEIAAQHMSTPPTSMRSKIPTIPRDVEEVVFLALSKDPHRRFANVAAFAKAFERACMVTPLFAVPPTVAMAPPAIPTIEAALQGPHGRVPLKMNEVSIGRAPSNQIILNDSQVSGRHALIRPDSQGYSIVDIGSVNGTYVNGQKIVPNTPRALNQGDAISVGNSSLKFEISSSGSRPPLRESQLPTERAAMPPGNTVNAFPVVTPRQPSAPMPPIQPTGGIPTLPPQQPSAQMPPMQPMGSMPPYAPQQPSAQMPPVQPTGGTPLYAPPPPMAAQNPPIQQGNFGNSFYNGQTGAIDPYAYASAAPPLQTQPPQTPARPPRPKRLWLILSIVAIVVLLLSISGGVFAYVNSLPTATKTLDAFCTAIQSGNTTTAYNQFAASYQKVVQRPDFDAFYGKANGCSHTPPVTTGNTALASWTLSFSGQNSTIQGDLSQDSSNAWKISDDTQLFAMLKMLSTYCTALQGGDSNTAYGQFSSNLQNNFSIELFKNIYPKVNSCDHSDVALTAKKGTATLNTVSSMGQKQTGPITMVEDASNVWKIDDLNSYPAKTMNTFCTALQKQDYSTAYSQFSSGYASGYTDSTFRDDYKNVTSCKFDPITNTNNHIATTATFTINSSSGSSPSAPYTTYLVQDSTGVWKIDSLYNPPEQTMTTFCDALNKPQPDYQTAYDQLSSGFQSRFGSEANFAQSYSVVANCTFKFPTQSGTSADAPVTFTFKDASTGNFVAHLIQIADNSWKIDNLTKA